MSEITGEWPDYFELRVSNNNSNNCSLQRMYAQDDVCMHNMSSLE